jgi:hypothetical protein
MLSESNKQIFCKKVKRHTIHATCNLSCLLVAPPNRREVSLIVHETTVEVGFLIRIRRGNVNLKIDVYVLV